jgi:hypothetical protein
MNSAVRAFLIEIGPAIQKVHPGLGDGRKIPRRAA